MGPYPAPMINAPKAATVGPPLHSSPVPRPHSSRAAWLQRTAPRRVTRVPPITLVNIAPR